MAEPDGRVDGEETRVERRPELGDVDAETVTSCLQHSGFARRISRGYEQQRLCRPWQVSDSPEKSAFDLRPDGQGLGPKSLAIQLARRKFVAQLDECEWVAAGLLDDAFGDAVSQHAVGVLTQQEPGGRSAEPTDREHWKTRQRGK